MSLLAVLGIVIVIVIAAVIYISKMLNYRKWLETDDGLLHLATTRIQKDPTDVEALLSAAKIYYKKMNYEKAFELYSRVIFALPNEKMEKTLNKDQRFDLYLNFGVSAYRIGKSEDSLMSLKKARQIHSGIVNLSLSRYLGRILFKKGSYIEAVRELEYVHLKEPNNKVNRFCLGISHINLGRFKEALPLLKSLEGDYGDKPQFLLDLARCYEHSEDIKNAAEYYKRVIEDSMVGADACNHLGRMYLHSGSKEDGLQYLWKVAELEHPIGEMSFAALYDGAKICTSLDKLDEACKFLGKLHEMNPSYKDTIMLLQNYQEMLKNRNLYLLYYGNPQERDRLLRKWLPALISGASRIESITFRVGTIDGVLSSTQSQAPELYSFWINLETENLSIEAVRAMGERSLKAGCQRCLLITAGSINVEARKFAEARPIDLFDGIEMRKKLFQLPVNSMN